MNVVDSVADLLRPITFRGKARIADMIVPRTRGRRARVFGLECVLDTSDFIQRHMYAGSYEREESRIAKSILGPGMIFVDIGANVGYYTALAASRVGPRGHVYSFEPSEHTFQRLKAMIDRNRLEQVTALNIGVSDSAGSAVLYGGSEGDGFNNLTATMVANENPCHRTVAVETLDRIAEQFNIQHVDLLKIDIDGYEMHVLRGAKRLLEENRIDRILMECCDYWLNRVSTSSRDIFAYLASFGLGVTKRIGKSENYLISRA